MIFSDGAAWQFLDTAFLETLYVIRKDILGVPMFCNVGDYTQRSSL